MALTRGLLKALGIEEDKISQIIDAHVETVNALKEQITEYKEKADKYPELEKQLEEQTKAAKKSGEDYTKTKSELDKVNGEYAEFKKGVETKEHKAAVAKAFGDFLKDMKVTEAGIAKIMKYASDSVELDEQGNIKNAADLKKTITDEWSEYVSKTEERGLDTKTPPKSNPAGTYKSKEDILKITDAAERQKAIKENPALFGLE